MAGNNRSPYRVPLRQRIELRRGDRQARAYWRMIRRTRRSLDEICAMTLEERIAYDTRGLARHDPARRHIAESRAAEEVMSAALAVADRATRVKNAFASAPECVPAPARRGLS